jgi:exodeoxyribonuclease VII large subunit
MASRAPPPPASAGQSAAPAGPEAGNLVELSVSDLARALKRTVEAAFDRVRVRGEISGFKRHSSGHLYFALKDADAVLDAVMWRGTAGRLAFRPEDGLEVVATGRLTTYPGRSKYQIVVERMEPAGEGALLAQIEERKRRLAAEGLFAEERKRQLPFLPQRLGIVTSPTGAVIRDILHRLADRFPREVLLWPVAVQGPGAADQVAAAIAGFNAMPESARPDLLIVARGGGSIEDLMAFNEEAVVRAAAASAIPLISAVGHETDTTLIDFASDRRAPTPTAAAEMAVPVRAELAAQVGELGVRLARGQMRLRQGAAERLQALAGRLPRPQALLGLPRQRVDDLGERLGMALLNLAARQRGRLEAVAGRLSTRLLRDGLARERARLARPEAQPSVALLRARVAREGDRLAATWRMLETLSPEATLRRGYALVLDGEGRLVRGVAEARVAGRVRLRLADGEVQATVDGAPASRGRRGPPRAEKQGDLF